MAYNILYYPFLITGYNSVLKMDLYHFELYAMNIISITLPIALKSENYHWMLRGLASILAFDLSLFNMDFDASRLNFRNHHRIILSSIGSSSKANLIF